jgi:molybdopterin-guanine dinucleotide biosynthesis protein A
MVMPTAGAHEIVGVILAGGRARRMGGRDKALLPLARRPLIGHVLERLAAQVDRVVISANGDAGRFAAFGVPVVADARETFEGPLAGILAGMTWAGSNSPMAQWIATVPADTPFVPRDLVSRLRAAVADAHSIAIARSNGTLHQVVAVIPIALRQNLETWLRETGDRAVKAWLATVPTVAVDFPSELGVDPFFNINTLEDLARAEAALARLAATSR